MDKENTFSYQLSPFLLTSPEKDRGREFFIKHLYNLLTSKLLVVTRSGPFTLLDHFLDSLSDFRSGADDVLGGQLIKGTSFLDVLEGGFEVFEFGLDGFRGGFGLFSLLGERRKR